MLTALLTGLFAAGCDLRVLNDETAITQDGASSANGTVLAVTGMLKEGFRAHQEITWSASLIGEQELSPNRQNQTFVFAARISNEGLVAADNSQNRTMAERVYTAFSLANIVEQGVAANRFSPNDASDARVKALMLANVRFMQAVLYTDLAKFFETIVEPRTNARLTPDQAKQRSIELLQQAGQQWQTFFNSTAPIPSSVPVTGFVGVRPGTGGAVTLDSAAVRKFIPSYIAMLHFDTGARPQALPLLANGYVAADQGRELGYQTIDALTGSGVYPTARNYFAFGSLNSFSPSLVANRIPADTLRRAPSNWFVSGVATAANYFYPPAARYPLISWQEVALMQAQLGAADSVAAKRAVLQSWNIPAPVAMSLSADPTMTLERVARYEYVGRGRRWAVGNPQTGQPWRRWPLSDNLNIGN
jgi:hypothetical protein